MIEVGLPVENITDVVLKNNKGQRFVIIDSEEYRQEQYELAELRRKSRSRYVNKTELKKLMRWGDSTLRFWESKGLKHIPSGGREVLYDLDELGELMNKNKQ